MIQMKLNIYQGKWGERRLQSGRKCLHSKGVAHRKRERVKPGLVILKGAILKARKKGHGEEGEAESPHGQTNT